MSDRSALRTLVFVLDPGRILLARKKRGFGAGKWNGLGGKVEVGESIEAAAIRESWEEAGVQVHQLERRGVLDFQFTNGLPALLVHVFVALEWEGVPRESEEMAPQWFLVADIPYEEMWVDDPHWLPLLLSGASFTGFFQLATTEELLSWRVEAVARERLPRHI